MIMANESSDRQRLIIMEMKGFVNFEIPVLISVRSYLSSRQVARHGVINFLLITFYLITYL